jgi:ubiquinone/menaquinone biosynthesis C-methylase UbiE
MADEPRSLAQVRAAYDRIGSHFAKTRANPWPEIEAFLADRTGRLGLDVGCGNGRHTAVLAECVETAVGLDVSPALLATARERVRGVRGVELLQGEASALPLASNSVSLALYVATLHHLPDRATRRASLDDLARVLAPDGSALVSAWSTAHDRFDASREDEAGFDTTVDWTLPDGETVPRFYHIYAPAEFERDIAASALAVESVVVSSGNCYAHVEGKHP